MFLSCSVHVSDVSGLEQELSRRCNELSDKKADKDFVLSILKAVRTAYLNARARGPINVSFVQLYLLL